MAGKAGTVYIKADRNVEVAKTSVMIGDVLKIECTDPAMLARIRSIHLLTFHHPDDKRQRRTVVSLLKVIQKIHEIYPDAAVENIGETDFIVTYEEQDGKGGIIQSDVQTGRRNWNQRTGREETGDGSPPDQKPDRTTEP